MLAAAPIGRQDDFARRFIDICDDATRWSDADIAATLNRMGMPTGQSKTWTAHRVSSVRRVNGIDAYRSRREER